MSSNDLPSSKAAPLTKELRVKTEATATMVTMDRDGLDDLVTTRKKPSSVVLSSSYDGSSNSDNENKPSWWKRGLETLRKVASNDDEEEEKARGSENGGGSEEMHYKPLEDSSHPRFLQDHGLDRMRPLRGSPRVLRESLLDGNEQGGGLSVVDAMSGGVAAAGPNGRASQEDALQKDCSFFYKAYDDEHNAMEGGREMQQPTRGRFRALRHEEHQHAFSYQDAVDILAPTFVQQYKSRYQQLNQVDPNPLFSPSGEHDLILTESEENLVQVQRIVKTNTTVNSTIFYEHHDGRVLMRLPMDAVRLVMDPDLEPGVLSVEQWRRDDDDEEAVADVFRSADQENKPLDERPPLRYVLTVSPDLYRKVVSEMSDGLTSPNFGISKCCSDNEKADIRIAIAILCVVLFALFIVTMARDGN